MQVVNCHDVRDRNQDYETQFRSNQANLPIFKQLHLNLGRFLLLEAHFQSHNRTLNMAYEEGRSRGDALFYFPEGVNKEHPRTHRIP